LHVACRLLEAINRRTVPVPAYPGADERIILNPHASIGIAEAPAHADTGEVLKAAADSALRLAKKNGRNRVESAS
jgi:GGDEF domain-containing protein